MISETCNYKSIFIQSVMLGIYKICMYICWIYAWRIIGWQSPMRNPWNAFRPFLEVVGTSTARIALLLWSTCEPFHGCDFGILRVDEPKSCSFSIGCKSQIAATVSTFGCTGHNPQNFLMLSGTKILMFGLLLFRFGCLLRCSFFLLFLICSTCSVPLHLIVDCVTTTLEAPLWSIIEASFWLPWFMSPTINPPTQGCQVSVRGWPFNFFPFSLIAAVALAFLENLA